MKTVHFLHFFPPRAPRRRPAGRVGKQLAAVMLAVLVTPATLPVREDPAPAAAVPHAQDDLDEPGTAD